MEARLRGIFRYPVKSLGAEPVAQAVLQTDAALAWDRVFAVAHGRTKFDESRPRWVARSNFVHLAQEAALSTIRQAFDERTRLLTLTRGKLSATANPTTPAGRCLLSGFLCGVIPSADSSTRLVYTAGRLSLTDTEQGALSIINLGTLGALQQECAAELQPARFRGNLLIDAAPWVELSWVGRHIAVGTAVLKVVEPIERCAAINVNPLDGHIDTNLPALLKRRYGHTHCGVLCHVVRTGHVSAASDLQVLHGELEETHA